MAYNLIDTHCHITCDRLYERIDEILHNAKEHHVERMLVICTDFNEFERANTLRQQGYPVDIALGFHPNDIQLFKQSDYERLEALVIHKDIVAIGEIGLDYHYEDRDEFAQKEGFHKQLKMAKTYDLPILIHMRDATKDTMDILKQYQPCTGIMHCYSGSYETAQIAISLGLHISFGGPLTFKNSRGAPETVKKLPLERLLIETDCPYLTPHPFRGHENEPMYLEYTFKKLCEIKKISEEEMSKILQKNYETIFQKER